jgi:uncharacterized damage-inducible protein DinB
MMRSERAYEGLTLARQKLFEWVRPLTQEQYTQQFPIGLHTLRATLLEIAGGEWIYTRRLQGEPLPPREDWPINEVKYPTFAALEATWTEQAKRTRAVLASIADWDRPLEYRALQSNKTIVVNATTGDVVTQLLFHEVHHRAQAMAMLRLLGIEAQNLDYSLFMYRRREESA